MIRESCTRKGSPVPSRRAQYQPVSTSLCRSIPTRASPVGVRSRRTPGRLRTAPSAPWYAKLPRCSSATTRHASRTHGTRCSAPSPTSAHEASPPPWRAASTSRCGTSGARHSGCPSTTCLAVPCATASPFTRTSRTPGRPRRAPVTPSCRCATGSRRSRPTHSGKRWAGPAPATSTATSAPPGSRRGWTSSRPSARRSGRTSRS